MIIIRFFFFSIYPIILFTFSFVEHIPFYIHLYFWYKILWGPCIIIFLCIIYHCRFLFPFFMLYTLLCHYNNLNYYNQKGFKFFNFFGNRLILEYTILIISNLGKKIYEYAEFNSINFFSIMYLLLFAFIPEKINIIVIIMWVLIHGIVLKLKLILKNKKIAECDIKKCSKYDLYRVKKRKNFIQRAVGKIVDKFYFLFVDLRINKIICILSVIILAMWWMTLFTHYLIYDLDLYKKKIQYMKEIKFNIVATEMKWQKPRRGIKHYIEGPSKVANIYYRDLSRWHKELKLIEIELKLDEWFEKKMNVEGDNYNALNDFNYLKFSNSNWKNYQFIKNKMELLNQENYKLNQLYYAKFLKNYKAFLNYGEKPIKRILILNKLSLNYKIIDNFCIYFDFINKIQNINTYKELRLFNEGCKKIIKMFNLKKIIWYWLYYYSYHEKKDLKTLFHDDFNKQFIFHFDAKAISNRSIEAFLYDIFHSRRSRGIQFSNTAMNEIVIHRYFKSKTIEAKINTIWSDSMSKRDRRYKTKYGTEWYSKFMQKEKRAKNIAALWGKDTVNVRDKIEFASYWTKNINNIYRDSFESKNRYMQGAIRSKYNTKLAFMKNFKILAKRNDAIEKNIINNVPLKILKLGMKHKKD